MSAQIRENDTEATGQVSRGSSFGTGCPGVRETIPSTGFVTRAMQLWRQATGRVRWKMVAIIGYTGSSSILITLLAIAALNAVLQRVSANVVEKQLEALVQASRGVSPAILDHADICNVPPPPSAALNLLFEYTDEAFPQATVSMTVSPSATRRSTRHKVISDGPPLPGWLASDGFAGVVVNQGQLEIRTVAERERGGCKVTAVFTLPLGAELAQRISSAASMEVIAVPPRQFHLPPVTERILSTIRSNFIPATPHPVSVVLTVRNWQTGSLEDWLIYQVLPSYSRAFISVTRLGSKVANWVWLLVALAVAVMLMNTFGIWMSFRLSHAISSAIDELSRSARHIAAGNLAWRAPVRSNDQLGELICNFNEMAASLERLQKEEAAKLRFESEMHVAERVHQYLFPRLSPVLPGVTISGRTVAARIIGGDLYDFFGLDQECVGVLCADVTGKGIPAALMMANLQAIARAYNANRTDGNVRPTELVETLNNQLTGRFGDNRYATLFWAEYNATTRMLKYVNAGHPAPILIRSTGDIERLNAHGIPIGMFKNRTYQMSEIQMDPGSRLVIFTDGVTDALNADDEDFGEDRLLTALQDVPANASAMEIVDSLVDAAHTWAMGVDQFDDTTVIAIAVGS